MAENDDLRKNKEFIIEINNNPSKAIQLLYALNDYKVPFDYGKFNKAMQTYLSQENNHYSFDFSRSIEQQSSNIGGGYKTGSDICKVDANMNVQKEKDILKYNQDAQIEFDNEEGLAFSGKVSNNNGNISGGGNLCVGTDNSSISAGMNIDEQGNPTHSIDASATTNIGTFEWTAAVHNDRTDTNIAINGKKPLLRRDNNPNSDQAIYQEQKEQLEETGERFSVALKGGYSNEDSGFYTSNSVMANLGKGNFLNFKIDLSKYKSSAELMADLKKFMVQYTNSSNESKEGVKSKTQGVNMSLKGQKNIYTANWSVETQNPNTEQQVKNVSFGAKASLNRTQYGEFNSGLNGDLEANVTQQGYKFGIDGAYNYYGYEHDGSNDYMVSSKSTLNKDNNGTKFETGLYGALRFNGCSTIIEPRTIFEWNKDANGNITRKYINGVGLYQQLGRNFEDLTAYVKGERVIFDGGNEQNYSQILAGLKKKATDRVTLNAEGTWNSNKGCSGNIGVVVNF